MANVKNDRRAAIVRSLKDELDMTYTEIGEYLGLHKTSIHHLYRHGATGSRRSDTSREGRRVRRHGNSASRYWTPETILEAGRRYLRENGTPPTSNGWDTSGEWWPASSTVARVYPGGFKEFVLDLGYIHVNKGRGKWEAVKVE